MNSSKSKNPASVPNTETLKTATSRSLILSVPHSGTRFLKGMLGVREAAHTMSKWSHVFKKCEESDHIIVPLRNPHSVWLSWCRRRRFDSTNQRMLWYRSWFQLHTADMLYDLDVICIDKQEDPRIAQWSAVGHDPGYDKYDLVDMSVSELWELPIVRRHYQGERKR